MITLLIISLGLPIVFLSHKNKKLLFTFMLLIFMHLACSQIEAPSTYQHDGTVKQDTIHVVLEGN